MKRFNEYKRNKKRVKDLVKYLNRKGIELRDIVNWNINYYERDRGAVHFTVGEYRFGVWFTEKVMFAEHLGYMDKFKPSASSFSKPLRESALGGYNLPIHNFINEVMCYGGKFIHGDDKTDLEYWRRCLREEIEGIQEVVEMDRKLYHKIKNSDERIVGVRFITPCPSVWQGSRLEITLGTNARYEERCEIKYRLRDLCKEIFDFSEKEHSKIYQALFNGCRIAWVMSIR